jgi:hypothetical protein
MKPLSWNLTTVLAAAVALTLAACGDSGAGRAGGSCTRTDPTSTGLTMCHELENRSLPFEDECEATGGTFSPSACVTSSFARRCRQVLTVNGVERADLHYFQAGSEMSCAGDETEL